MQAQAINESTKERHTVTFTYKGKPYTCHLVREVPNNDECSDWYIEELSPEISDEELWGEVTGEATRLTIEAVSLECICGNPEMGFDCVCDWVKANPGMIDYTCEFCGIYKAGKPRCNKCEKD